MPLNIMQFSISDNMISEFMSGISAILALVAVGWILSIMLVKMAKRFPFSRLALVLALAPFSLIGFMDRGGNSTLYLYAMIVLLLGITIDGIAYLLEPRHIHKTEAKAEPQTQEAEAEQDSRVIVWGKAE